MASTAGLELSTRTCFYNRVSILLPCCITLHLHFISFYSYIFTLFCSLLSIADKGFADHTFVVKDVICFKQILILVLTFQVLSFWLKNLVLVMVITPLFIHAFTLQVYNRKWAQVWGRILMVKLMSGCNNSHQQNGEGLTFMCV